MDEELSEFFPDGMTEAEKEEMIDSLTLDLAKEIEEEESKTQIVNVRRLKELESAYKLLALSVKGAGVTYKLHEPFTSMGSININGKDIFISHPKAFAEAAKHASNTEIYPKLDGTVQINFTFHGIASPIE